MAKRSKTSTTETVAASAPTETKSDKFRRLAKSRVAKAVKAIANIGNLSGASYEYTPEQVGIIAKYLGDATTDAMNRFQPKAKAEAVEIDI